MDTDECIKSRRSVRKYKDTEVPTDTLMRAISLACWAPAGGGHQSWRFYVVKSREVIDRVADAVQEKVDLIATWPESDATRDKIESQRRKAAFFRSAPALIAVGSHDYESEVGVVLRERGVFDPAAQEMAKNRADTSNRIQTVGAVITCLLLALHKEGLGACWMLGPMMARHEIEKILDVPGDIDLFALVPVGYPAEEPQPKPRKPLEDVVKVI